MAECPCVKNHNPNVTYTQEHHIVPKSWVAQGGRAVNPPTVSLCGTAHDSVHELLNEYVRWGGRPPWNGLKHYSHFIRRLAATAWDHRPAGTRPPLTTAQGVKKDDDSGG